MYCPNCRTEYKAGITTCADCGTKLIANLPPEPEERPELVSVFETNDLSILALAKSMLEEAGIAYVAKGELPMSQLAVGPAEIQVDRDDKDMAHDLLRDLAEGLPSENELEGEDGVVDEGGYDEESEDFK
jgi:hypothetical protein